MECGLALISSEAGQNKFEAQVSADFVYEDRVTGGFNFGRLDAEGYRDLARSMWLVGQEGPKYRIVEVLVVRGDLICLVRAEGGHGSFVREGRWVMELAASRSVMRRFIEFDSDDLDAALAEVEELAARTH